MQNERHGSRARQILTYLKKKMTKNGGFLGLSQPFEVYLFFCEGTTQARSQCHIHIGLILDFLSQSAQGMEAGDNTQGLIPGPTQAWGKPRP